MAPNARLTDRLLKGRNYTILRVAIIALAFALKGALIYTVFFLIPPVNDGVKLALEKGGTAFILIVIAPAVVMALITTAWALRVYWKMGDPTLYEQPSQKPKGEAEMNKFKQIWKDSCEGLELLCETGIETEFIKAVITPNPRQSDYTATVTVHTQHASENELNSREFEGWEARPAIVPEADEIKELLKKPWRKTYHKAGIATLQQATEEAEAMTAKMDEIYMTEPKNLIRMKREMSDYAKSKQAEAG